MTVYEPTLLPKTRTMEERVIRVLQRNGREGLTVSQMMELFGASHGTVVSLCDKLAKKGMLDHRLVDRTHFYSILPT